MIVMNDLLFASSEYLFEVYIPHQGAYINMYVRIPSTCMFSCIFVPRFTLVHHRVHMNYLDIQTTIEDYIYICTYISFTNSFIVIVDAAQL